MPSPKIFSLDETDAWLIQQRTVGHRVGFTCGSFDLLHAGHVQYLTEARKLCDSLLVAVNSDDSIRRYKNPLRPIQPLAERQYLLAALSCVDAVTTLDHDRPVALIERWKPDLYIKGGDYAGGKLRSSEVVVAYGGRTVVIPQTYPTSTSLVLERIQTLQKHAPPEPAPAGPNRIVFLDRDGTLIENIDFLNDPGRVRLKNGVGPALVRLRAAGFRLVIVTNQQGMGLGYFNLDAFIAVNQWLLREIGAAGGEIDRIYFCPHSFADHCDCRKPRAGMLTRACREFNVQPQDCFFIGDRTEDRQAGEAAGIRTFLLGAGTDFERAAAQILAAL